MRCSLVFSDADQFNQGIRHGESYIFAMVKYLSEIWVQFKDGCKLHQNLLGVRN